MINATPADEVTAVLQKILFESDLSLNKFAKKCNISLDSARAIKNGHSVSNVTANQVFHAFDVKLDAVPSDRYSARSSINDKIVGAEFISVQVKNSIESILAVYKQQLEKSDQS